MGMVLMDTGVVLTCPTHPIPMQNPKTIPQGKKIDGGVISLLVPFIHVLEASQECMLDRLVFTLHAQGLQSSLEFLKQWKDSIACRKFLLQCVDARTLRQLCANLIICH